MSSDYKGGLPPYILIYLIIYPTMKKIILLLMLVIPFAVKSQAHLGATITELRQMHPSNVFTISYTTSGTKYAETDMALGKFVYYFNEYGITYYCIQIPYSITNVNTQVEIYNSKYTITSKTSWTAYLDGGGIMIIKLLYDNENQLYYFGYSS